MSDREFEEYETAEVSEPPQWLEDFLRLSFVESPRRTAKFSQPSERFRQRCEAAARTGSTIARLRIERRRIGFVPLALAEYLQGLFKVAGLEIEPVLKRFDLQDISSLTEGSARKLARLAQELEISLREVLIQLRIGFLERHDSLPVPLLLAHHRSTGLRDQLAECEAVLGLAEAGYDGELLNELRRTEFEIRAAYKQGESKP